MVGVDKSMGKGIVCQMGLWLFDNYVAEQSRDK